MYDIITTNYYFQYTQMEQFSSGRSESGQKENGEPEKPSNITEPEERRQKVIKHWESFRDFGMKGLKPDGLPSLPALNKESNDRVNKFIFSIHLRNAMGVLRDRVSQPKKPDRAMDDPKDPLFAKYKGFTQRDFPDGEILLPSGTKLIVESVIMLQSPHPRRDGLESSVYRQGAFTLRNNDSELQIVINNAKWYVSVDGKEVDLSDNDVAQDINETLIAAVKALPPFPSVSDQKAEEKERTRKALKKLRLAKEQGTQ